MLRECIEASGLTITHAAAALGVTRNTLLELANGKRGISPEMAVRLSKADTRLKPHTGGRRSPEHLPRGGRFSYKITL